MADSDSWKWKYLPQRVQPVPIGASWVTIDECGSFVIVLSRRKPLDFLPVTVEHWARERC